MRHKLFFISLLGSLLFTSCKTPVADSPVIDEPQPVNIDSLLFQDDFYGGDSLITENDVKAVEIDDRVAFTLKSECPVFVIDSANMVDMICAQEGWRTKAYRCPKNVLTIGHGITNMGVREVNRILHTKHKRVREGDKITKDESIAFMMDYCKCADIYFKSHYKGWRQVLPYVKTSIMSYCYQRGWYGFSEKVCGKENKWRMNLALRNGDNDMIIKLLEEYTLNDGYTNRRTAELNNAKKIYKSMYYTALNDWREKNNIN